MLTHFRTRTNWNPWNELERWHDEFSRWPVPGFVGQKFPAVNVWQNEQGVIITADLPGVQPDDIDLTVHRETVQIRGHRNPAETTDATTPARQERFQGEFSRAVSLPFEVDPQKTEASFDQGVLTVKLGRPDQHQPLKISIKKV